jgi:hypothetical protein
MHETHKEIAEQLGKEIKVRVEKLTTEQDEIMRKFREVQKKVDEANDEHGPIVNNIEMKL